MIANKILNNVRLPPPFFFLALLVLSLSRLPCNVIDESTLLLDSLDMKRSGGGEREGGRDSQAEREVGWESKLTEGKGKAAIEAKGKTTERRKVEKLSRETKSIKMENTARMLNSHHLAVASASSTLYHLAHF